MAPSKTGVLRTSLTPPSRLARSGDAPPAGSRPVRRSRIPSSATSDSTAAIAYTSSAWSAKISPPSAGPMITDA